MWGVYDKEIITETLLYECTVYARLHTVKIYITGASGTGKSSIVRALQARGVKAIDMDVGLCHWESRQTGAPVLWEQGRDEEWYRSHGWMCNIKKLEELLAGNTDVVVAGLSSNQDAYLPFFDKILILHTSPEVVVARLKNRTDNDYGKHPLEQQRLLNWHKSFEADMVARGAIPIDADRPLAEVVADVEQFVRHT